MTEIVRLARVGSTQDVVRAAARSGAAEGYCCVADEQTSGRGRQGRSWVAPAGAALLASVLLRPSEQAAPGVPIAAGLAVVDALEAAFAVAARLRWPNDVVAGGGKLAGLLAEVEPAAAQSGRVAVVLGLGLNLTVAEFPAAVAGASLHRLAAAPPDRDTLLEAWLSALRPRLATLEAAGIAGLRDDWRRHAVGLGEPVEVRGPIEVVRGTAEDIDGDGALLVRTPAGVVRVLAGDVHLSPPPA
ncbi:MAG: biotin--[acetyl-CoA-carboxylase] ligase [Chloroflexi bacterium]|nr:MAG: biotin--[acetyl-CoA-carboxylase] ligase [Chloroflexota bacterium]